MPGNFKYLVYCLFCFIFLENGMLCVLYACGEPNSCEAWNM